MEKNWHLIYTRPRCEKKVTALLARNQVEHFCPVLAMTKTHGRAAGKTLEPVFAGYVFVFIAEDEQPRVKSIAHVVDFVYWLGSPAPIQQEEIDAMRFLADESGRLQFEQISCAPVARKSTEKGPFLHWRPAAAGSPARMVGIFLPCLATEITAAFTMKRTEQIRFLTPAAAGRLATDSKQIKIIPGL